MITFLLISALKLLVSVAVPATMVTLYWEPVTLATDGSPSVPEKYTIYRAVGTDPPVKLSDLYHGTAFVDLVTFPGVLCYQGTSTNGAGESKPSNLACVRCRQTDKGQIQCR
jgi:hypothetical protein